MSDLPKGWVEATLDDLVTANGLVTDGDWVESKDQDPSGEVRLTQLADVGEGHFRNRSDRYMALQRAEELGCTFLQAGDVLIARMPDPLGRACIFPGLSQPAVTVVDVLVFRSGTDLVSPQWIMSAINATETRQKIIAQASGTTRQRISGGNLKRLPLPLPPLAEQKRIVAKLDALNAKSARARTELARIETLVSRYKQAVLSKAFSGEFFSISETGRRREASKKRLSEICQSITDGDHQAPPKAPSGVPFITISAMNDGRIDLGKATRFVPESYYEELQSFRKARTGDILYSVTGSYGIPAIVETDHPFVFQRHIAILRPDASVASAKYLKLLLASPEMRGQADAIATGTAQKTVPLKGLRNFEIPIPSIEEQHEIVHRIESAFAKIDRLAKEAKRALELVGRLDEAILAKAFRGELVPQDENDEPASSLLDRIREARTSEPSRPKRRASATKGKVHDMARTIIEALAEAKDWLAAQELFASCGVRDGSSTEDVEKLYRQLLDLERQDRVEIEEMSDPLTGAKLGNRVRLRK